MSLRRVCVVQARMGSTRLPGKVLREVAGRPMLAHIIRRLQTCSSLDDIVIATSVSSSDDPIADFVASIGVRVFRGSEVDVLDRMLRAARAAEADVIVRVTGDCPLIDPTITDLVITELTANSQSADYASNVLRRTFPRGLDVEAMFLDTLIRVDRLARSPLEREHVTVTIRSGLPQLFVTRSVESDVDDSDLRWTVDEASDFELVTRLYEEFGRDRIVPYTDVVGYVRQHPELTRINADITTWAP